MSEIGLDRISDRIYQELLILSADRIAAFSASCSERFVGLYEDFVGKSGWGDFSVVRKALDLAWTFLSKKQVSYEQLRRGISNIDRLTPHSDDFDLVETTFAQDACGCVYQALAWCLGKSDSPEAIVECSFEAIRVARTFTLTGTLDLGSGPSAQQFEKVLVDDPYIQKEIRLKEEDLAILTTARIVSPVVLTELKQRAEQNRWEASDLLGN